MCKEEMTHGHRVIQPGKKKNNAIFRDIYKPGIIKLCKDQKEKNTIIIGYMLSLIGRK